MIEADTDMASSPSPRKRARTEPASPPAPGALPPPEDARGAAEHYDLGGPLLGAGSFGKVKLVKHRQTGAAYACKLMPKAKQRGFVSAPAEEELFCPSQAAQSPTAPVMKQVKCCSKAIKIWGPTSKMQSIRPLPQPD